MAIFVKDSELQSLRTAAANYLLVVSALTASGEGGVTQEEVTPQMIIDALSNSVDSQDLAGQLTTARTRIGELEASERSLQAQVTALQGSPANDLDDISADGEIDGKEKTLVDFANKNAGNPGAIINEAVADGFLPKNYQL